MDLTPFFVLSPRRQAGYNLENMNGMRNMTRAAALIAPLALLVSGCIRLSPEAEEAFGRAFGEALAGSVEANQNLKFLVSWYYQAQGEWPEDRGALERFIEEHSAPMSLEDYTELSLETGADDVLSCQYTLRVSPTQPHETQSLHCPSVGSTFRLSKQEAIESKQHLADPDSLYSLTLMWGTHEATITDEEPASGR